MASGNFTTGSLTPSITQLAACGSTSNVVSGGHQSRRGMAMPEKVYVYWREGVNKGGAGLLSKCFGPRHSSQAMRKAELFIEQLAYYDHKGEIKYR